MIAFDNGPADGDYVRYIEAMAKDAATHVAAQRGSTSMVSTGHDATGFDDVTSGARARRQTATPAATAAVAQAMALQNAGNRISGLPALGRGLGFVLGGALLVLIGLSLRPTSVLAVVAGIAIFAIGFRLASNATATLRARTKTRSP